ncbi:hypothetical protein GGS26DRAFT_198496 [Hypomontagnella submonticulosa]|nr:hypothetical protein GGS26DRAFT_198496 [Hypomontagnella submonticulosa]
MAVFLEATSYPLYAHTPLIPLVMMGWVNGWITFIVCSSSQSLQLYQLYQPAESPRRSPDSHWRCAGRPAQASRRAPALCSGPRNGSWSSYNSTESTSSPSSPAKSGFSQSSHNSTNPTNYWVPNLPTLNTIPQHTGRSNLEFVLSGDHLDDGALQRPVSDERVPTLYALHKRHHTRVPSRPCIHITTLNFRYYATIPSLYLAQGLSVASTILNQYSKTRLTGHL